MQKWRRDYLSRKMQESKYSGKEDKGFTLVELLASIAILSVVILLAGSVHMFGQRQFISQSESANQANDMSYALSVISRDLRKESFENVTVEGNTITVSDGPEFKQRGQEIVKNDTILSSSVREMHATANADDKSVEIILRSSSAHSQNKEYRTTIYFRR